MSDTILPARMPLNDMSWQGIKTVALAGKASEYWKPGDTKTIILDGTIVFSPFRHLPVDVFILGIDHNSSLEGRNHIHFGIGMKEGRVVGLNAPQYPELSTATPGPGFIMNSSATSQGGWENSYMRTRILGAAGLPTDPPEWTLLAALPRALREVMTPITKYTDNNGRGKAYDHPSDVTPTLDSLWLLSESEIYGQSKRSHSNVYEQVTQAQYDFFRDYPKKLYTDPGVHVDVRVWCRSRIARYYDSFCCGFFGSHIISSDAFAYRADELLTLLPCFAV